MSNFRRVLLKIIITSLRNTLFLKISEYLEVYVRLVGILQKTTKMFSFTCFPCFKNVQEEPEEMGNDE